MSKRNVIFICVAVGAVIILAFIIFFVTKNVKKDNSENMDKITLIKYDESFEVEKTIVITKGNKVKEIKDICDNPSLEQDEMTQYLAIRNDVKLDLGNGIFYMIQLDLTEYCYYEDTNSDTKLVIKMPNMLLEKVNSILNEN